MTSLTRRRFLQSASLLAGAAATRALLGTNPQPAPPFAKYSSFEPTALFLTWQRDPTTTMTIHWLGAEKDAADRPVWFAKDGAELWQSQPAVARPFPMTDRLLFRTELTGLQPDAEYRFRVGLDSPEARFRTMPARATNTIHFVSGGDSGIGPHAAQTNRLAAAQAPMFVVLGGDLAYENGRDPGVFLQFLKNYSRDLRDNIGRLIPLLACIGNHEVVGGYGKTRKDAPFFYSLFDGLFRETGYASLDFGDYLSLIFLDSGHTSHVGGDQTHWLEKTLQAREDCPNVFAFNHVPAYPSHRPFILESAEIGIPALNRKHWSPLFERYNIDAVFEHHDHTYKRTHPLLDGRTNDKGVLYLGDGSWGQLRKPASPASRPYLAVTHEAYHLSLHRLEGPTRYHLALADSARIIDLTSTTKRPRHRSS